MKQFAMAVLLSTAALASAGQAGDSTVLIKTEDAEMQAAIEHAQATLDDFLKLNANAPAGASQFRLKVKVKDSRITEHMWVTPFKQTSTGFVGILADEPEYVKGVTNGQRLTFARADVSDWGYVQDGKQKGSFTVCVLFKNMPADQVKQYREQNGFEC
jgi:uncharacterized protein YegJ (DUF2314 family)